MALTRRDFFVKIFSDAVTQAPKLLPSNIKTLINPITPKTPEEAAFALFGKPGDKNKEVNS
ncbi:MAG: hypothetical protein A2178_00215 [Planctomycetes bacterium GWC2_49_10]|nr:MAG: hypothetical protein A2178_00215 [Planctomycetes bacterium GWC2_49_10]